MNTHVKVGIFFVAGLVVLLAEVALSCTVFRRIP